MCSWLDAAATMRAGVSRWATSSSCCRCEACSSWSSCWSPASRTCPFASIACPTTTARRVVSTRATAAISISRPRRIRRRLASARGTTSSVGRAWGVPATVTCAFRSRAGPPVPLTACRCSSHGGGRGCHQPSSDRQMARSRAASALGFDRDLRRRSLLRPAEDESVQRHCAADARQTGRADAPSRSRVREHGFR